MSYSGRADGFLSDLPKAEQAEREILKTFQETYVYFQGESEKSETENQKLYDYAILTRTNKTIFIEIKDDAKSKETRNVFVPISSLGSKSGLTSTCADIWLQRIWFLDEQKIIMYKVDHLKNYLLKYYGDYKTIKDSYKKGYRSSESGILVPVFDFVTNGLVVGASLRNYFHKIKPDNIANYPKDSDN